MASVSSKDEADMRARTGRELRRKSQKTIFDARQRLTSSSGTRASFDFELLDEYAGSRLSGVLAMPVLLIILGLFSSLWVPPAAAAVWVVLALTSNSMVILVCRRFKQTATAEKFNAGQWTASFVAVETVFGICWSLLSLFSLVARSENLSVAMFAMVLVGIAGNAVSTRTLPPSHKMLGSMLGEILRKIGVEHFEQPPRLEDAQWVGYRLAEILPLSRDQKLHLLQERDPWAVLEQIQQAVLDLPEST